MAAQDPNLTWSNDPDLEVQAKRNVLLLHDHRQGTHLMNSQPVLCASCHVSPPLQIGDSVAATLGGTGVGTGSTHGAPPHSPMRPVRRVEAARFMSAVMHDYHGRLRDSSGDPVFPPNGTPEQTCYTCHPGAITQCLRGAMKTGGMECFSCHGDMLAVGGAHPLLAGGSIDGQNDGQPRRPWKDVPRCQSCHSGDASSHSSGPDYLAAPDGIRLRQAWRIDDESASSIKAVNQRFAEDLNAQYRGSKGHGGLSCEACHGSTHAEWPNADPAHNDNIAAIQLQGHSGPISECGTCHASLAPTTSGPHGLHNVNSLAFVRDHDHFYESNPAGCQACHGTNLMGTVLSRAAANRSFQIEDDQLVNIAKGTRVRCNMCHELPGTED